VINENIVVADNTLGILLNVDETSLNKENIASVIDKPSINREWFTENIYQTPSFISGNALGFVVGSHFDFRTEWNGNPQTDSIAVEVMASEEDLQYMSPKITSSLGSGILTFEYPFAFKTQPGIKLITINPPNMLIPGATVMSQVIETDTEESNFSFSIKFNVPGIGIEVKAGTPLVGVVPIHTPCINSYSLEVFEN
jgi:hypothetical protein